MEICRMEMCNGNNYAEKLCRMEIGNGRGCNGNLQWMTLPSHRNFPYICIYVCLSDTVLYMHYFTVISQALQANKKANIATNANQMDTLHIDRCYILVCSFSKIL